MNRLAALSVALVFLMGAGCAAGSRARPPASWRAVEQARTQAQVAAQLGEPTRKFDLASLAETAKELPPGEYCLVPLLYGSLDPARERWIDEHRPSARRRALLEVDFDAAGRVVRVGRTEEKDQGKEGKTD